MHGRERRCSFAADQPISEPAVPAVPAETAVTEGQGKGFL